MRTDYPRHLAAFSYVGFHRYFLTFCTDRRRQVFVDRDVVDAVVAHFLRAARETEISLIAYCFMPDHMHLVVEGTTEAADLKAFVSRAKQYSGYEHTRKGNGRQWQRYTYEHVLRDAESTRSVVFYVLENPLRANLVDSVEKYPFIGSSIYTREALIEFACHGPADAGHDERWSG